MRIHLSGLYGTPRRGMTELTHDHLREFRERLELLPVPFQSLLKFEPPKFDHHQKALKELQKLQEKQSKELEKSVGLAYFSVSNIYSLSHLKTL